MQRFTSFSLAVALLLGAAAGVQGQAAPPGMAAIPAGVYRPFFNSGAAPRRVPVKAFCLDAQPVTVGDFLAFLRANPRWQRSRIPRLLADEAYLKNWADDLDPGRTNPTNAPVTQVSWFAANAYAAWRGKRLPTVAEWESAAAAGPRSPDGASDAAFNRRVLAWYTSPAPAQPVLVGSGETNFWGIHDLHGLIWEWVADFNSDLVGGDARNNSSPDRELFCGAGASGASDPGNFPAFMRYGFRSSLKADYCIHNLGFRCAIDAGAPPATARPPCCRDALEPAAFSRLSLYQTDREWTNDAGGTVKLAALAGQPQLVVMYYSHCQSACPLLVNELQSIAAALPASLREHLGFTLVSFDPRRDDPTALHEYRALHGLDHRWTLLTGPPGSVRELAALLGVRYQSTPGGDFLHSNLITLLNAEGEIVFQQTGLNQDPAAIIAALQRLDSFDAHGTTASARPALPYPAMVQQPGRGK